MRDEVDDLRDVRRLVDENNATIDQAIATLALLVDSLRPAALSEHEMQTIDDAARLLSRLIADQRVHLGPRLGLSEADRAHMATRRPPGVV